jgi:hypothetical protein
VAFVKVGFCSLDVKLLGPVQLKLALASVLLAVRDMVSPALILMLDFTVGGLGGTQGVEGVSLPQFMSVNATSIVIIEKLNVKIYFFILK